MPEDAPRDTPPTDAWSLRGLLAPHAGALAGGGAATLAVVLGAYALARWLGAPDRRGVLVAVLSSLVWASLAAPALASGASRGWGIVLRGGVVADAAGVGLLLLAGLSGKGPDGRAYLTILDALQLYLLLAAIVLLAAGAVAVARGLTGRRAAAVLTAVILGGLLSAPFWIAGPLAASRQEDRVDLAAHMVRWNPVYSAAAAADGLEFVWHEAGWMYRITPVGEDIPIPPSSWYDAVWRLAVAAAVLALIAAARRRLGTSRAAARQST